MSGVGGFTQCVECKKQYRVVVPVTPQKFGNAWQHTCLPCLRKKYKPLNYGG